MHVGELALWECHQILDRHTVGRIGVSCDGYPLVFPINYRFLTRETAVPSVLVRTRPGNSISRSMGPASFEIDEIDLAARRAVSVLVRGQLVKAPRWTGLPDTSPWVTEQRDDWLAIEIETITGRRFVGRSEGAGDTAFDVEWQLISL
jgi:uncharacterized protein